MQHLFGEFVCLMSLKVKNSSLKSSLVSLTLIKGRKGRSIIIVISFHVYFCFLECPDSVFLLVYSSVVVYVLFNKCLHNVDCFCKGFDKKRKLITSTYGQFFLGNPTPLYYIIANYSLKHVL